MQERARQKRRATRVGVLTPHSLRRTAKPLYVRDQTVKYGFRRASDLLSADLRKLDDLLAVRVALMVRSLGPETFDRAATT